MTTWTDAPADPAPSAVAVRACAGWLALRREVDVETRDRGAGGLLERLAQHLRAAGAGTVRLVDVGAGTGANRDYLAPRLPLAQEWVVVDHDADLLGHVGHGDAVRVEAGAGDLAGVLAALPDDGRALVVTCAALLDVLARAELEGLADAVAGSGAPALLSLSVTGRVDWWPRDPADGLLGRAFDAHQRRDGRPGPDAVRVLREDLALRGLTVLSAATPWGLDAGRPALLERWLEERVEVAAEQEPAQAATLLAWHERRRDQLRAGLLAVRVHHEDLLVLPR